MSDRGLLIAFLLICLAITVCLFVLGLCAVRAKRERERRLRRRVRPAREEAVDLAAERMAYIASRDSYLEQRDLRRVA